jgi:hypothetical protein
MQGNRLSSPDSTILYNFVHCCRIWCVLVCSANKPLRASQSERRQRSSPPAQPELRRINAHLHLPTNNMSSRGGFGGRGGGGRGGGGDRGGRGGGQQHTEHTRAEVPQTHRTMLNTTDHARFTSATMRATCVRKCALKRIRVCIDRTSARMPIRLRSRSLVAEPFSA